MIIIGERLNSTRTEVLEALRRDDIDWLAGQALRQQEAGARFIDINCAALLDEEARALARIIPELEARLRIPLAIDSPNAGAIEVGLKVCRARPLLNSITGEAERLRQLLPLIDEYKPRVIALCLDDEGLPQDSGRSLDIARRLTGLLLERGLSAEDVFLDPLVHPVGVDPESVRRFLRALDLIKSRLPAFKTVAGLSNVSFGMPSRRLLNRTFLALCLEKGLDAAIIDPLDEEAMDALSAAECLLGGQDGVRGFLKRSRTKKAVPA